MMAQENQWWHTEENDEVATSPDLWRPLSRAMGGFDLDPAAGCEPTQIAEERYTRADDGLSEPWYGTVWLNPPFSEKTAWYRRLVSQYTGGDVEAAVALATVDASANWFHRWFSTADVLCFHSDRDLYLGHGDSPAFSTQVGVWNPTQDAINTLRSMGTLARPETDAAATRLEQFGGDA